MKRVFGAFFVAVVWLAIPALASANCQSKVFGNSYDCNIAYLGGNFSECLEFGSYGSSIFFDAANYFDTQYLSCTCQGKGSANNPKFNASGNQLECTGISYPDGFVAKVSGKKIKAQSVYDDGTSAIYTCKLRSSPCP
jgi:hypothetical protein